MADQPLALRRAVIAALKADSGVAALVGARVYEEPPAKVTFPFVRYSFPISTPFYGDGWSAQAFDVTIDAFSVVNTDEASTLAAAVQDALSDIDLDLGNGAGTLTFSWRSTNLIRDDDEASAYHAIVSFDVVAALVD